MARGRGVRSNGRSKKNPAFFMLYHHVTDSAAWQSLSPGARTVILEIGRGYTGSNNGLIVASHEGIAKRANMRRQTVALRLAEAERAGLIKCQRRGTYTVKCSMPGETRASEWRIMWLRCDKTGDPAKQFPKAQEI